MKLMATMTAMALLFAWALLVSTSEGARVGKPSQLGHPGPSYPMEPPLPPPAFAPKSQADDMKPPLLSPAFAPMSHAHDAMPPHLVHPGPSHPMEPPLPPVSTSRRGTHPGLSNLICC
jgi:hypothetical protein